jgi:hypothetical protein
VKQKIKVQMVAHAYNPSYSGSKRSGEYTVQGQPGQIVLKAQTILIA